jgi:hypothetical protein
MLTIENYDKIVGKSIGEWKVLHCIEGDAYYYFGLSNKPNAKTAKVTINLDRVENDKGFYCLYKDLKRVGPSLSLDKNDVGDMYKLLTNIILQC